MQKKAGNRRKPGDNEANVKQEAVEVGVGGGKCKMSWGGVDGEVNQTVLLVLNLSQLKSCGIRLGERLSQVKLVFPVTRQEPWR